MSDVDSKPDRPDRKAYMRAYMRKRRAKLAQTSAISETDAENQAATTAKNHVGRPSTYDQRTAEKFCGLIAGGMGIKAACAKGGISTSVLYDWRRLHPEFDAALQCAIRHKIDLWSDDLVEIADRANDDEHDLDRMIRVRQWLTGKHLPHKYGNIAATPAPPEPVKAIEDGKTITVTATADDPFADAQASFEQWHAEIGEKVRKRRAEEGK